jgi:murein DD-endopeptidase MepM/ murein hydrolase activator NlpD
VTSRHRSPARFLRTAAALLLIACGCRSGLLRSRLVPPSPHEQYAGSLRDAGLDAAALGRQWLSAAQESLRHASPRSLPLRETGYFAPERPEAVAYRVSLRRGERLTAAVTWEANEPSALFADLFAAAAGEEPPRRVVSAVREAASLDHEVERDGDYVMRLQPELLRGGRYTVTIRTAPSLAFPVRDGDVKAIGGLFGDARDGGQRRHEGLDIFAPRGTHAVAAADGIVLSAGANRLGGNVVWLLDSSRGLTYYYAHLDEHAVRSGERVRAGETVGLIGNTGNARRAPPHLHFAIYPGGGEGAVDARPFVAANPEEPPPLTADVSAIGRWRRVTARSASLASAPGEKAPRLRTLPRHAIVRVGAATAGWYHVTLPDGESGFVSARGTEPAERPLRKEKRTSGSAVLDYPGERGALIESVPPGGEVSVIGLSGDYLFVAAPGGAMGWLAPEGGR